jgi:phosphoribosylaminoimidazole-succinocarboxamide synthase
MERNERHMTTLLYEGKAKKLYQTDVPGQLRVEYLNQATALNGQKKDAIAGKGALNNQITARIFTKLSQQGIRSHFIAQLNETEQLVQAVDMIPLEVVLRNIVAGSFSKRLGVPEGQVLEQPIIEFYYKDDALDDPFINDAHIRYLGICDQEELRVIRQVTLAINRELQSMFETIGIQLVDFKLEFGRDQTGKIILADEISPDTCRLWDAETHDHLDKDLYRRDLGDIVPVYQEVLNRLNQAQ